MKYEEAKALKKKVLDKQDKESEKISPKNIKAQLLGTAAGLGLGSTHVQRPLQHLLGELTMLGEKAFQVAEGSSIPFWENIEFLDDANQVRRRLKIPLSEIAELIVDKEPHTLTRQTIDLIKKIPFIKHLEDPDELKRMKPYIALSGNSLPVAAHELGHNVRSPVHALSFAAANLKPITTMAGVLAGVSGNETLEDYAPLIGASAPLVELLEEARASTHATRAIRAVKGNRAALSALGRLGAAFGTHALAAAPYAIAPALATAVAKYVRDDDEVEKQAEAQPYLSRATKWMAGIPKPPSSTKPNLTTKAQVTRKLQPPSKRKYYEDEMKALSNLNRRQRPI